MVVWVDRFPEPIHEIGKSVGEEPKAFFRRVDVGLNF